MRHKLKIVDYDATWPLLFESARAEILQAVGPHIECVEYVGSTSVEGLAAKPIIDIQVGVRDWDDAKVTIAPLVECGWIYRGERGIPRRHFFGKRNASNQRTHHLHMLEVAGPHWNEMLVFRDYLRTHRDAAAAYAELKRALATRAFADRGEYTDAKAPFIQRILALAVKDEA
jgi:GrpB-like predicted nucleotidyltransferase (UPF0157 family)